MNQFSEKNKNELLIISSGYPDRSGKYLAHTFVKGYVDEAKNYYETVFVLVLLPYVPKLFRKLISKRSIALKNYSYENVRVEYRMYPYIPLWPFTRYKGRIAYLFLSSKVLKSIKNVSIIHANFTSPSGVFAYFLSKKIKKDYILTVHEDHDWLIKEVADNNSLLINTWQKAKTLIRVNHLDNKLLAKFNKNIVTIPNGFNHKNFKLLDHKECKKKLKIPYDKKVIINIGFYNKQKNQKLLIDAISLLPKELKNNLECFIIGGGLKQRELEAYVNELDMANIIHLTGQISHDELPVYLNASNIFCLSSNSEGNPTVMFEALGAGIPYVGTNVGGVPEIITSEKFGLLCRPNNKENLKDIIEKGIKKDWDRNEIIKYSKQFSWKNIFLKTKQYY